MTLKTSYRTTDAAEADLAEHGFTKGRTFWSKPSLDGFGYPMTALASVEVSHVDGRWAPDGLEYDYYTVEFHNR